MLGAHFYNEATRKTVIGFGTLFNNIELKKVDPNTGDVLEVEKAVSYTHLTLPTTPYV